MRKTKFTLLLVCMTFVSMLIQGQEQTSRDLGQVVVTGNRFETPIEKSGKVIYKVTRAQIERTTGRTVADILNGLPGIYINGAFGTPGTNLSYNIRGGRNRHTLILIDGLPVNDPSAIANDYDLRLINANEIEYIEVLKGGASTLYGTNAAAGVINIKLREPDADSPSTTLSHAIGSFQSMSTTVDVEGKAGKLNYLAGSSFSISDGISAATSLDPTVIFENDGYYRYTGRGKLNYVHDQQFSIGGNIRYENFKSDYDGGAFFDQENQFDIRQLSFGLNPRFNYKNGELKLKVNYNRIRREFVSAFPAVEKGYNLQSDLSNAYVIKDQLKIITGLQYQEFSFDQAQEQPKQTNIDPYLHLSWDAFAGLTLNGGVRMNINSEYGSNLIYTVNPSYLIDLDKETQFKLFASYSTAFVAPSLFQLFSSFYGNEGLEAEETQSTEIGASLYLSEKVTLNAAYFDRQENNAIDFVSLFDGQGNFIGGEYQNIDGTRELNGLEIDMSFDPFNWLSLSGNYTDYNFGDPTQFYSIPAVKYGAKIRYTFAEETNLSLTYQHFGARQTQIFTDPFLVTLEAFNMLDLNISHRLFDGDLIINGAIYNLLDEEFDGVYGYNVRPINFSIGLTAKF